MGPNQGFFDEWGMEGFSWLLLEGPNLCNSTKRNCHMALSRAFCQDSPVLPPGFREDLSCESPHAPRLLVDGLDELCSAWNSLRSFFIFSGGIFELFWALLALLGALVGAKWWGKVVGFDCLILSQIGLILTELC